MVRPKIKLGNRGPTRQSDQCCIPCAYSKCKSGLDVKNVGSKLTLDRGQVAETACRPGLRKDCKTVRFCCEKHKLKCLSAEANIKRRGPREPLDSAQIIDLAHVLREEGAPWAVVVMLLQLQCGERGGCMVQAKFGWLKDLSPHSADSPCIEIPKVNGKTKPRIVPLIPDFATLLHGWINGEPLRGGQCYGCNSQWPFTNQSTDADTFMFPSASVQGFMDWSKHVTRHGFHKRLRKAADRLRFVRGFHRQHLANAAEGSQPPSTWENYNFTKLGTHSMKRSSISMMKDLCASTALVGSVAGTSAAVCDKYYDSPTAVRQRDMLTRTFGPLFRRVRGKTSQATGSKPQDYGPGKTSRDGNGKLKVSFCPACGKARQDATWKTCPWCSRTYEDDAVSPFMR